MDARNPLKLSYRFVSYLEKHRICELFQELSTMLLIKKPEDHVLFLKQSLSHAARRLDAPRVILLAPPGCDKLQLAGTLREKLQVPLITFNDIADNNDESSCTLEMRNILENLRLVLMNYMSSERDGWILIDFPRNEKEARSLLRSGVIPSHVIEIVSLKESKNYLNSTEDPQKCSTKARYYRELRGIRRAFSKFIKTVNLDNETIDDVSEKCLNLFDRRNYMRTPTTLRILMLSYGSQEKCKCLGLKIAEETNVTYVDFHQILERVSLQETDLGDELRKIRQTTHLDDLPSKFKVAVFEDFVLRSEALKRGWLLTQFVSDVDDFKQLDLTDFPPNRVVIIVPKDTQDPEKSSTSCVSNQTSNSCSTQFSCACEENRRQEIRDYAGKTAYVVEDDKFDVLKERIQSWLMLPPVCVPARIPRSVREIKPEEVEYDPDDEPSVELLDCIRRPEPMLALI